MSAPVLQLGLTRASVGFPAAAKLHWVPRPSPSGSWSEPWPFRPILLLQDPALRARTACARASHSRRQALSTQRQTSGRLHSTATQNRFIWNLPLTAQLG